MRTIRNTSLLGCLFAAFLGIGISPAHAKRHPLDLRTQVRNGLAVITIESDANRKIQEYTSLINYVRKQYNAPNELRRNLYKAIGLHLSLYNEKLPREVEYLLEDAVDELPPESFFQSTKDLLASKAGEKIAYGTAALSATTIGGLLYWYLTGEEQAEVSPLGDSKAVASQSGSGSASPVHTGTPPTTPTSGSSPRPKASDADLDLIPVAIARPVFKRFNEESITPNHAIQAQNDPQTIERILEVHKKPKPGLDNVIIFDEFPPRKVSEPVSTQTLNPDGSVRSVFFQVPCIFQGESDEAHSNHCGYNALYNAKVLASAPTLTLNDSRNLSAFIRQNLKQPLLDNSTFIKVVEPLMKKIVASRSMPEKAKSDLEKLEKHYSEFKQADERFEKAETALNLALVKVYETQQKQDAAIKATQKATADFQEAQKKATQEGKAPETISKAALEGAQREKHAIQEELVVAENAQKEAQVDVEKTRKALSTSSRDYIKWAEYQSTISQLSEDEINHLLPYADLPREHVIKISEKNVDGIILTLTEDGELFADEYEQTFYDITKIFMYQYRNTSNVPPNIYIANTSKPGSHWLAVRLEKVENTVIGFICDSLCKDRTDFLRNKLATLKPGLAPAQSAAVPQAAPSVHQLMPSAS